MNPMNEFITAIETDAAFEEKIHAGWGEGKISEVVEAAAQKGFTITEADLREQMDNRNKSEELSEDALEEISGGSGGAGTISNPYTSETCWFLGGILNKRDCFRLSCKAKVNGVYLQCCCWGQRCYKNQHHIDKACR